MVCWVCSTEGLAAEGASSGGSSAVEQRTVKCASAAILWSGVQISLSGFFFSFGAGWGGPAQVGVPRAAVESSYDHTTVKAPHPIRTAKLSTVGPDQYYGRGLRGNLRCCMAFFILFLQIVVAPTVPPVNFSKSGRHTIIPR